LATLAFDERRREIFKKELILALNLIQTQKLVSNIMLGSWAGAMGNFQFMPSTLTNNAVDGDGDGVVDIWKSLPDAFASAAHYLKDSGWKNTGRWGEEVLLPSDFDYSYALDYKEKKPLSLWRKLGVKRTTQKLVANSNTKMASLFAPIGKKGPAFLLYDNFHVIMRWNASTAYALGVGILSDRITGRPKLKVGFKETKMLSFHEIKEVQEYLKKNDYYKGEVDGLVGPKMKIATYNYQKDNNLKVVDGYPDIDMYFAIFKEWHISNEEYKFEKKLKIVDDRAFEIERKSTSNLNTLVE
jgi:membrane-bound lytic murein transglycosylase B